MAVGTALDEYRAQAQDKYDDHVGAEETLEFGKDGTFADIDQRSKNVAQEAEAEHQAFSKMAEPTSETADALSRQMQDSANIAHIVQSQIRIRPIVTRWYNSTSAVLKKLPDVMNATANAIRVGTDVAQIWVEEWSAVKKRLRHLSYDTMHGLAGALDATAEILKRPRRSASETIEKQRDPEIVAAEQRVKAMLLAGEEVPHDLGAKVEILTFKHSDGAIDRISDFGRLANLNRLGLDGIPVSADVLAVLGRLNNLTNLNLDLNNTSDISAFGQLTNLTRLSVRADNTRDISALGRLTNLTRLTVYANNTSDISALGQLTNLTSLSVHADNTRDISALGRLTNLTSLSVYANNISDISALGQLTNLTRLSVYANNTRDISALGQLTNLTRLSVQASRLDLNPVQDLGSLTELRVVSTRDLDLAPVVKMKNLKTLKLANVTFRNLAMLTEIEVEIVGESEELF